MDLFSVQGGMSAGGSIGTLLGMIKETDPELHTSLLKTLENIAAKKEQPAPKAGQKEKPAFTLGDITAEGAVQLLDLLKTMKPDVYEAIKGRFVKRDNH